MSVAFVKRHLHFVPRLRDFILGQSIRQRPFYNCYPLVAPLRH